MEVPIGSGSGYVWDFEGHIVTNFHVVQQATSAQVAILTPSSTSVVSNDLITANSPGGTMTNAVNPFTSARPGALGSGSSSALNGFTRNVYKARVIGVDPTKGKLTCTCYRVVETANYLSSCIVNRYCSPQNRRAYQRIATN